MNITKIELNNFRNYKKKIFDNFSNLNIIIGKNGIGKTSIIEAIYLGSLAKSFKTTSELSIIKTGTEYFRIKIQYFDYAPRGVHGLAQGLLWPVDCHAHVRIPGRCRWCGLFPLGSACRGYPRDSRAQFHLLRGFPRWQGRACGARRVPRALPDYGSLSFWRVDCPPGFDQVCVGG